MIYFIHDDPFVKIGFSTSVTQRFRMILAHNPRNIVLLGCIEGDRFTECAAHRLFRKYMHRNEWFHATPEVMAKIDRLLTRRGQEPHPVPTIRTSKNLSYSLLRTLAVKADCDPRTILKVASGTVVHNISTQRAYGVLVDAGLLKRSV